MIKPVTIAEQLLFSTVRIQVQWDSDRSGTGTGFFFDFPLDEQKRIPVIITNKHVVADSLLGQFQLHEAEIKDGQAKPSGKFFTVALDQFSRRWIPHLNQNVDLCAMLFQPLRVEAARQNKVIFNISLDKSLVLTDSALEELSAVEDVLMVGYPIGLWDEVNNLPLIRRGITATHPAIDFCGRSEGVIDAACFPGSSGSPVVYLNEGVIRTKPGSMSIGGSRAALLGVLFGGPQMTAEGEIVVREIPTSNAQPIIATRLMINLGYYVKAREILSLGEHVINLLRASGAL